MAVFGKTGGATPNPQPGSMQPGSTQPGSMPPKTGGNFNGLFSRGKGGLLPERGSKAQHEMVMSMLQSAMSGANQSNSPLLSLLTPIIGGAVANGTQGLYDQAQSGRRSELVAQLSALNGGGEKHAQLLELMMDPDIPESARRVATSMYDKSVNKKGRRRGGLTIRQRMDLSEMMTDMMGEKDAVGDPLYTRDEVLNNMRSDPFIGMLMGPPAAPANPVDENDPLGIRK